MALGVEPNENGMTAFVGAGGKTTAAWRLLDQLTAAGHRAVFTTTTHVFEPTGAPLLLDAHPDPAVIARRLEAAPRLVLAATHGERGDPAHAARSVYPASPTKLVGLEPEILNRLVGQLPGVTWLVEADGARGRLLKAPAAHEPVIPSTAGRVVVVAGLEAIGQPLDSGSVHRPEVAARLLDVPLGTTVTPRLFVALVSHAQGGLKTIPAGAEVAVLLTRWAGAPSPHAEPVAEELLSHPAISRVVILRPGGLVEKARVAARG